MPISLAPDIENKSVTFNNTYSDGRNNFGVPDNQEQYLPALTSIKISDSGKPPVSTPSVYRRPIDFYNVLKSPGNWPELSKKYRILWREMITLLALNDIRGYNIKFEKVPLDNPPQASTFLQTCADDILLPNILDGSFGGMTWKKSMYVVIFKFKQPTKDEPNKEQLIIGATSPMTIVFPSEDFHTILHKNKESAAYRELNTEEKKCVFDWLMNFIVTNDIDNSTINQTLYSLVYSFMNDLKTDLTDSVASKGWKEDYSGYEYNALSRFNNGAFTWDIPPQNGVDKFNVSIKKIIGEQEWYALFIGLALNDLRVLGIRLTRQYFINSKNNIIAEWADFSLIKPVENVAVKIGLVNDDTADPVEQLSIFEKRCVWQYLRRLQNNLTYNTPAQLLEYIDNLMNILISEAYSDIEPTLWDENRFVVYPAANKELNPFNFSVHYYIAPFYEDEEGKLSRNGYAGPIINDWFNLLYLIALRNLRNLNINYTNTSPRNLFWISNKSESPLCEFNSKTYSARSIRVNGVSVAITCCDTLFAIISDDTAKSALDKVFTSFWNPTANELNNTTHNIGPCRLYDFEIALLIEYLNKILFNLNDPNNGIKNSGVDRSALIELIQSEKSRLYDFISPLAGIDFLNFYNISGFANEPNVTVKYFFAHIEDNLFEKTLIAYDANSKLVHTISNSGGRKGYWGTVYSEHNGNYIDSKEEYIILPFTELCCNYMYNFKINHRNSIADIARTTLWYGVDYIETYRWDYEENTANIKVYDVRLKLNAIDVPMIKRFYYDASGNISSSVYLETGGSINIVPGVTVWPDVEIECWKEYYMNVINLGESYAPYTNIVPPSFIEQSEFYENEIKDVHFNSASKEIAVNTSFITYKLKEYPRMLKLKAKIKAKSVGAISGFILTRPYATKYVNENGRLQKTEGDSFISDESLNENTSPKAAVVGVDFGTTNSTAYFVNAAPQIDNNSAVSIDLTATPKPLNLLSLESNFMTIPRNETQDDMDKEIREILTSQRKWVFDSERQEYYTTFPSTLLFYSKLGGGLHYIDGAFASSNIYRMSGMEIANYNQSILQNKDNLKYGMKWDLDPTNIYASKNFLTQFIMMCCVFAVKEYHAKKIEIRASYPTSMTDYLKQRYQDSLEDICHRILGGNTGKTGLEINIKKLVSESLCSGLACIHDKIGILNGDNINTNNGVVSVDIGGGSTDIAILTGDKNAYNQYNVITHLSLPYAAQYIFTAGKRGSIEFMTDFFKILRAHTYNPNTLPEHRYNILSTANEKMSEQLLSNFNDLEIDKQFKLLMDTFIANIVEIIKERNENEYFYTHLNNFIIDKNDNNQDNHLTRLAKIKMATLALLYFIGLLIKKLINEDKFTLVSHNNVYTIDVFLAGNGSRIFDWVNPNADATGGDGYREKLSGLFSKYVSEALKGAKGINDTSTFNIRLHKSNKPKHETSYGLLFTGAADDLADKSKFSPVNVDTIIYEYGKADRTRFRTSLKSGIQKMYSINEIDENERKSEQDIDQMSDVDMYTYLTSLVNSEFDDEHLAEVISDFLEVFAYNSPYDFKRVYPDIIFTPDDEFRLNSDTKKSIKKIAIESLPTIREPVNKGDEKVLPLAVRSFSGYAILKYVTAIINN